MADTFYITTPLYYVNDAPHIGHAYTTVAADVVARWRRLKGHDVHFLTGTDEHGQKVLRAAHKRGLSPQTHVDELCQRFQKIWERLDISHDDFIRTTQSRHTEVVQETLQALYDRGDITKKSYEGWYSTSEERFWTEKDVVDGPEGTKLCPASGLPVEWIAEENYFFDMGKYADQLREHVAANPDWIRPEARRNELLGALKKEVGDLCITRPKSRLAWGIEVPFDHDYVTYVWFDALLNYVSAVGYRRDDEAFRARWPADYQLLGKDILTTHTIYWGTMLFALDLPVADCLYAHGWWTVEGQKMSKSLGNVVDPHLLVDAYGADSVRYVLMAEKAFGGDGDFSHKGFQLRYNADLANKIGNLANRALSMNAKWLGGKVPALDANTEADDALAAEVAAGVAAFDAGVESVAYKDAVDGLLRVAVAGNEYVQEQEPWALNKDGDTERLAGVLRRSLEVCRVLGVLLAPFCPNKSASLLDRLGSTPALTWSLDGLETGASVSVGDPLFPRMLELPEQIAAALALVEPPAPAKKKKKSKKKKKEPVVVQEITFDDFQKVQLKAGKVLSAEPHPDADRLLVLQVDVGEEKPRQIVAGIAARYALSDLVGLQVVVVANLAPAQLRGVESQGMLLAAGSGTGVAMVSTTEAVDPGTIVR
ncbi:MAG: methionine--tRNA ligase [Proteobacteria bacterium]|nr:methionine--tRNA ligase [Pseudomonadota bacterium]MCP4921294.1 methionine--tRNA ligase [Pseudomonadota bacterium]